MTCVVLWTTIYICHVVCGETCQGKSDGDGGWPSQALKIFDSRLNGC